jgi:hypothetical protein
VTCANAIDSLEANKASVKTTRLRYTLKIFSHVPAQRVDDWWVQPQRKNCAVASIPPEMRR